MIAHSSRGKPTHSKLGNDGETLAFLIHSVADRYQRLVAGDFQQLRECLREFERLSDLAGDFPEKQQLMNCSKVAQTLIQQITRALNSPSARGAATPNSLGR